MSMMPVDLENLAAGYTHRPTSSQAQDRAARAARSVGLGPGDVALDVGGGPGRHASVWTEFDALAVVIDPSPQMTRAAVLHPGVAAIRASAQNLPVQSAVISLAYFHLSIHYGDWKRALDEALRVLRPGGKCWVWTMGEQHHRASFLARWFPSVGDIDAARFPPPAQIADYLMSRGTQVKAGQEIEHKEMSVAEWRAGVAARFVSTLQLIPEEEFGAGLQAFDRAYPDGNEVVDYVLTFDWIRATR